jgi:glycerophosphoryl diester phosphodiesterase
MHDGTVDRTTNGSYSGAVSSLYYSQLETLDAGSWFSGIYRGTRVPSFVTELKYVKPYAGVNVMPELKGAPTTSQLTTVSNAIKTYMPTRTVVQSFSSTNLTRFHAINPAVPLALTTDATPADPVAALRAARATYWLPNKAKITAAQVSAVKAAGIKVMPWTADSTVDWQTLSEWGVDGILSNKAVQYTGWAAARCGTDL